MRIVLASGNPHKVAEFQALAGDFEIVSAREHGGMPAVEENAGTFRGNARLKALALARRAPAEWVLADDSGLCVDALGGAPGVESAYFAGPQGDPAANLQKLIREVAGVPPERRQAHFVCMLCLRAPGGAEEYFEGRCGGHLLAAPRGGSGFGYDPLFVPEGFEQTYAELGDAEKNRISHRARAWAALATWARRGAGPGRTVNSKP